MSWPRSQKISDYLVNQALLSKANIQVMSSNKVYTKSHFGKIHFDRKQAFSEEV